MADRSQIMIPLAERRKYRPTPTTKPTPPAVQAMIDAQAAYANAQREYERLDAEQQVHAERTQAALVAAREAYAEMMVAVVKAQRAVG